MALLPAAAVATLVAPEPALAASAPTLTVNRAATGKVTLAKGATYKLGAQAESGAKVTYSTSKKSVATVSAKGTVTAKGNGTAAIYVKAKKSGKTTTKKVAVTVVAKSKIKAVKKVYAKVAKSSISAGTTTKVSVSFSPASPSNRNVTFKSSNTKIATVNAYGTVTGKKPGTAYVTATSCQNSKRYAKVKVTVTAPLAVWNIDGDGKLSVSSVNGGLYGGDALTHAEWKKMQAHRDRITSVSIGPCVRIESGDWIGMFAGWKNLKSVYINPSFENAASLRKMFYGCSSLEEVAISASRNSKLADASYMFAGCSKLRFVNYSWHNVDLRSSQLKNVGHMFDGCSSLEWAGLRRFNVSKVTNFSHMFAGCSSLRAIDTCGWDTSSAADVSCMFDGCITLGYTDRGSSRRAVFPQFDASCLKSYENYNRDATGVPGIMALDPSTGFVKGGNVEYKLDEDGLLTIRPVSDSCVLTKGDWNAIFQQKDAVTKVLFRPGMTVHPLLCEEMFKGWAKLESVDMSALDLTSAEVTYGMFYGCKALKSLDLSFWNTSSVKDMGYMFYGCSVLESLGVANWDVSKVRNMDDLFCRCSKLVSLDLSGWNVESVRSWNGFNYDAPNVPDFNTLEGHLGTPGKWFQQDGVEFMLDENGLLTVRPANGETCDLTKEKWEIISLLKDQVISIKIAAGVVASEDLSSEYDRVSACCAWSMFGYDVGPSSDPDLRTEWRRLVSADLSGLDVSALTNMMNMFAGCGSLESLDLSGWDLSNVTNIGSMFASCSNLQSLDLSGWNVSRAKRTDCMFQDCSSLKNLDLSGWNISSATNMNSMFRDCSALQSLDVASWNVSRVTNMGNMFNGCAALQPLDLSGWKVANVDSFSGFNTGAPNVPDFETLDISGTWQLDGLEYSFTSDAILTIRPADGKKCVLNREKWTQISKLHNRAVRLKVERGVVAAQDLSTLTSYDVDPTCRRYLFGASNSYMEYWWNETPYNTNFIAAGGYWPRLVSADLSGLDVSAMTNMSCMFFGLSNLQELNLSGWNTSNVTDMSGMFYGCASLKSVNLSSFKVPKVKYYRDFNKLAPNVPAFSTLK